MKYLRKDFAREIPEGDLFHILQSMQGKVYREVKGRKTLQFRLNDKSYFVKNHLGVGWSEILKNLFQLRMPILGAENEWRAIKKLESLDIATMTIVAYADKGWNPARRQSFIVTEDLEDTVSLEDYCKGWPSNPPTFAMKHKLLREIARISRTLHRGGICHRDFYLCHFLMPNKATRNENQSDFILSVIDLHRALIKKALGKRWLVKDISGLLYSAMDIGLTQRDYFRFMKLYDGGSLRESVSKNRAFWKSVQQRAHNMHRKLGPVK
jgi:heptose I phosphotransferase